jgi:hypothetical protein
VKRSVPAPSFRRHWASFLVLILAEILVAPLAPLCATSPGFAPSQSSAQTERPEIQTLLPLTSFYSTPTPLPPGRPGELIRSSGFAEYEIPEVLSVVRILYHSRSADGQDVAVSGVVLTPGEPAPAGGWPVIAWAHGFTGAARTCAPSLMRNLYQGPYLSMYVSLGYAVVATDYAGLGTNPRNASLDMNSNAADVLYSIAAARAAVPQLGRKWLAMGEAEGGFAAIGIAESEDGIRDPDYLGSVAISPVDGAKQMYSQIAEGSSPGRLVFLAYGVKTIYPQFQLDQMLSEKGMAIYHRIESGCTLPAEALTLPASQLLKPGWEENRFVQRFLARNSAGERPARSPLLIISSGADAKGRRGLTDAAVERMCKQRDVVQFREYRNSEFSRVLGDSVRDQLDWIQGRFAGRPAPNTCH